MSEMKVYHKRQLEKERKQAHVLDIFIDITKENPLFDDESNEKSKRVKKRKDFEEKEVLPKT